MSYGLTKADSIVIPHQTSTPLLFDIRTELGVPSDQFLINADRFGNCGSAGAISVLAEHWQSFAVKGGNVIPSHNRSGDYLGKGIASL